MWDGAKWVGGGVAGRWGELGRHQMGRSGYIRCMRQSGKTGNTLWHAPLGTKAGAVVVAGIPAGLSLMRRSGERCVKITSSSN
jgi:hypothetical protein